MTFEIPRGRDALLLNRRGRSIRQPTKRRPTAAVAALALVGCAIGQSSRYDTARRSPDQPIAVSQVKGKTTSRSIGTSGEYLLALGDSLAAGYQPSDRSASPPVDPSTGFSDQGYPGGYAADLAAARHLSLVDLACPGETTTSMVGTPAKLRCETDYAAEFGASSQLSASLAFLARHKHEVALVSIDLGANDIEACTSHGAPDAGCVAKGAASAARELPTILGKLKRAIQTDDPGSLLVGMNYYDPFLGLEFSPGGPKASAAALLSLVVVQSYNQELAAVYGHAGVPVANVASAFASDRVLPLTTYASKRLPRNVALVCNWTWMCPLSATTGSPDIHPNTAGYGVVARAFEKVLAGA